MQPSESLVVGKSEAARLLGLSVDTIDRLIADRELPAARLSRGRKRGRVMIRVDALRAFVLRREAQGL